MSSDPTPEGDLQLLGEVWTDSSPAPAVVKGQLHAGANVKVTCGSKDQIQIWGDGYDDRTKHLAEYQNHFPLPNGTCEVSVLCAGPVVTFDLFDRSETFAVLWDRLSRGYFFDVLRWPAGSSSPDAEPAECFFDRPASFAQPKTAIGLGAVLEFNSTNLIGAVPVYNSRLCHLAAFADAPQAGGVELLMHFISASRSAAVTNASRKQRHTVTRRVSNADRLHYLRSVCRLDQDRLEATMSDAPPLVRQWMLLRILSGRHYGATVKEMAAETSVSEKTIRRDLELFHQVGFPIEEVTCERGRKTWRLDPARSQLGLSFAFDGAIALYLGRRLLEPLAGTPFWEAAQRAFKKVRASLTPKALKYVESFGAVFHQTLVGSTDYTKKTEIVDQLMQGIEDRRAVFITYQSLRATEPVTYDIYPYGLVYHRGSLYLVGVAPDYGDTLKQYSKVATI